MRVSLPFGDENPHPRLNNGAAQFMPMGIGVCGGRPCGLVADQVSPGSCIPSPMFPAPAVAPDGLGEWMVWRTQMQEDHIVTEPVSMSSSEPSRRDFIYIATGAFGAVGVGLYAWPLIDQMNPSADTTALSTIEVDISGVEEGQQIVAKWQGKPVFIRHRTKKEIDEARAVDVSTLRDPQTDDERLVKDMDGKLQPQNLVMIGICTHLGCVPIGDGAGDYDGWFCPCHGSQYDSSGRIRKGPAPKNLAIPPYKYLSEAVIKIG